MTHDPSGNVNVTRPLVEFTVQPEVEEPSTL